MRFRYEAHKVVTVNREDVSTSLIERVLRALVFEGSPQLLPFDFPRWLDSMSFTLETVDGKSFLRAEWELADHTATYSKIPEDEGKQIEEMLQLMSAESTWFVVITLTHEDMTMYVECDLAKGLLEYQGEPVEEPLSVFCGVDTTNTNWDRVLNQAILTAQVSLHHEQPTTTESADVSAKEIEWPS